MDPNATLDELRRLVLSFMAAWDRGPNIMTGEVAIDADDALRMAELVQALDEWLCRGGFLPTAWKRLP